VKGTFICIDNANNISSEGPHHPCMYSRPLLVAFLNKVAYLYGFTIDPLVTGALLEELESDFSTEYLHKFPYVMRIVTGNSYKRKEYSNAFGLSSIEFLDYTFQEIQGTTEEIVLDKVSQLKVEDTEIVIVDDTGLEMVALDGFPGPYVKPFFSSFEH